MYWPEFITIALAHLFAVASPGPDFAVVLRQCVRGGTRVGLWTSLGVGSAIMLHVAYCLLGVAVLLSQSPTLFTAVRVIAALYLLYIGLQSIRKSFTLIAPAIESTGQVLQHPWKSFKLGFLTNGLNPKATLFFLALFTVVISPETPIFVQLMYGVYLAVATFAWFAILSSLLGRKPVREFILKAGAWFERLMGVILIALAVRLAFIP